VLSSSRRVLRIKFHSRDWFVPRALQFIIAQRRCFVSPVHYLNISICTVLRCALPTDTAEEETLHTVYLPVRFTITTRPIESVYTTACHCDMHQRIILLSIMSNYERPCRSEAYFVLFVRIIYYNIYV